MTNNYLFGSIVPGAQLDLQMWRALETMSDHHQAEIYVGRSKSKHDQYHDCLEGFLSDETVEGQTWSFRGGANILPTNDNPLSQVVAHNLKSVIVPSPKNRGMFFPTYGSRILHTCTGSLSKPSFYPATIQGDRSRQKHCQSVIFLQDHGTHFQLRVVYWKNGALCDYDNYYYPNGDIKPAEPYILKLPDIHCGEVKPRRLVELENLVATLKPEITMLDDLISFSRYSHHVRNTLAYGNHGETLTEEIETAAEFIEVLSQFSKIMVTPSNHHDHVEQWVLAGPKMVNYQEIRDYGMACLYYADAQVNGTSLFEEAIRGCFVGGDQKEIEFINPKTDFRSKNGVHYFHGHYGPNGSRNTTPSALSKIPFKSTIGHGHTPGWHDHAYRAGAAPDASDASYTKGASSWNCSAVLEHKNGVRQVLNLIKGEWF